MRYHLSHILDNLLRKLTFVQGNDSDSTHKMNSLTNKDKYRAFCETREDIPIFSEPWWLDAVCMDGNWDVCLSEKSGIIQGAMPFYHTTLKGLKVIRMPLLTPYLGVQVFTPSQEQKITTELIQQIPKASYIQLLHHPSLSNWLPFYWAGYKQTTMYTYLLNINNIDTVYSSFRKNLKRNLKKASQELTCQPSEDLELFYRINKATFERQKMPIPYSFEFIKRLDNSLKKHHQRVIFITTNKDETPLAAGYFVWDKQAAYYLAGGHNDHREAMSWTMWHAIQFFSNKVKVFDFEGSMVKNIAHFFNGFGAKATPYHHTFKGKNKIIDILKILKS